MPKAISNIQQYAKAKLLSYNVDFLRGEEKKAKKQIDSVISICLIVTPNYAPFS